MLQVSEEEDKERESDAEDDGECPDGNSVEQLVIGHLCGEDHEDGRDQAVDHDGGLVPVALGNVVVHERNAHLEQIEHGRLDHDHGLVEDVGLAPLAHVHRPAGCAELALVAHNLVLLAALLLVLSLFVDSAVVLA